ncbi:unnamed protein product [Blepharisma stoltei]|uniref:Uncharacterized protein n=1 Tax=Blepharisma stoltei TaxID=1481888 RepID=A0AAU9K7U8_9CILI|nr:unnamed protein product [Blepharisma stoltei]
MKMKKFMLISLISNTGLAKDNWYLYKNNEDSLITSAEVIMYLNSNKVKNLDYRLKVCVCLGLISGRFNILSGTPYHEWYSLEKQVLENIHSANRWIIQEDEFTNQLIENFMGLFFSLDFKYLGIHEVYSLLNTINFKLKAKERCRYIFQILKGSCWSVLYFKIFDSQLNWDWVYALIEWITFLYSRILKTDVLQYVDFNVRLSTQLLLLLVYFWQIWI